MRKQFLLVAMWLCLALSTSFPTLAANFNDGTVMPMAQECGNCGKMTLNVSVTYGTWEDTSTTVTCSKYSARYATLHNQAPINNNGCQIYGADYYGYTSNIYILKL